MPLRLHPGSLCRLVVFALGVGGWLGRAEAQGLPERTPLPRPKLTEALRAKVEEAAPVPTSASSRAVTLDRFIVREKPLPSGPPKEVERAGPFSVSQGGYLLKNKGEAVSTELGLWRHIDIMDDPREALRQTTRIRMSFLRFSW